MLPKPRHSVVLWTTGGIRTPLSQCKCDVLANYTTWPILKYNKQLVLPLGLEPRTR